MKRVSATELAALLQGAIIRLNRRMRHTRPLGELTLSQLSALTSLELGGALSPRELAETERVRPPTMTRIIAKLENRGLVRRTPHPTDGRQIILTTTEAGRAAVREATQAKQAWLAERLNELNEEEQETLQRAATILEKIASS